MKTELVTTLKREATRLLAELREDPTPVLITEHGRPAAYLVNVASYEEQRARMQILEDIARGERHFSGRVVSHEEAKNG